MASVAVAVGITVVCGLMINASMYLYLAELRSETGVPIVVSVLIFAILGLLVVVAGYAVYRLARFGLSGSDRHSSHPL